MKKHDCNTDQYQKDIIFANFVFDNRVSLLTTFATKYQVKKKYIRENTSKNLKKSNPTGNEIQNKRKSNLLHIML